jgi:hypothetical protein
MLGISLFYFKLYFLKVTTDYRQDRILSFTAPLALLNLSTVWRFLDLDALVKLNYYL